MTTDQTQKTPQIGVFNRIWGVFAGRPTGTRTPNPLIKSQMLCQLSYRPLYCTAVFKLHNPARTAKPEGRHIMPVVGPSNSSLCRRSFVPGSSVLLHAESGGSEIPIPQREFNRNRCTVSRQPEERFSIVFGSMWRVRIASRFHRNIYLLTLIQLIIIL